MSVDSDTSADCQTPISRAEDYLKGGLELYEWFLETRARNDFRCKTPLMYEAHDVSKSNYCFIDEAPDVMGQRQPVVGMAMDIIFDGQKTPERVEKPEIAWLKNQVREYMLKYFLRTALAFAPRLISVNKKAVELPGVLSVFDWCGTPVEKEGALFLQACYKRKNGRTGAFPKADRSAIIDLERLRTEFEWILLDSKIFDFVIPVPVVLPPAADSPQLSVPFKSDCQLILNSDFLIDEDDPPEKGVAGRYGFGFAFIPAEAPKTFLQYGPDGLGPAYMNYVIDVHNDGMLRFHSLLVANQPTRLVNISLNPVDWFVLAADTLSLGLTANVLRPLADFSHRLPLGNLYVDLAKPFITLSNAISFGFAKQRLCISWDAFLRVIMALHYQDIFEFAEDIFSTWASIPDWAASPEDLPLWVRTGRETQSN